MQIFIKNVSNGREITLSVNSSTKIWEIFQMLRIDSERYRLTFDHQELKGYHTLSDYKITNESTLHLHTTIPTPAPTKSSFGTRI